MEFMQYLKEYEKKVTKMAEPQMKSGKVAGKFSNPTTEVKNPVKDGMEGSRPKGTTDKTKNPSKPKTEMKNPVKDGMTGKKNPAGSMKFKSPSVTEGKPSKSWNGKKPEGAGGKMKFTPPQPEVKNPVKNNMGLQERANAILDGIEDGAVYIAERKIDVKATEKQRENMTSRAASLL